MFALAQEFRFGLTKPAVVARAVRILCTIGYRDAEIVHLCSALKGELVHGLGECIGASRN
jgi:hypothetical protein